MWSLGTWWVVSGMSAGSVHSCGRLKEEEEQILMGKQKSPLLTVCLKCLWNILREDEQRVAWVSMEHYLALFLNVQSAFLGRNPGSPMSYLWIAFNAWNVSKSYSISLEVSLDQLDLPTRFYIPEGSSRGLACIPGLISHSRYSWKSWGQAFCRLLFVIHLCFNLHVPLFLIWDDLELTQCDISSFCFPLSFFMFSLPGVFSNQSLFNVAL